MSKLCVERISFIPPRAQQQKRRFRGILQQGFLLYGVSQAVRISLGNTGPPANWISITFPDRCSALSPQEHNRLAQDGGIDLKATSSSAFPNYSTRRKKLE